MNIGDLEKQPPKGRQSHGRSFLYALEQRAAYVLAARMPDWVKPAHLSFLGVGGAVATAAALISANNWPRAFWIVPFAMAINWLGLSVDLPLARLRFAELPGSGMTHHLAELFSHLLLIIAFGFSPFLTLRSAAVVLVCYLLFSSYTYIRAATRHTEQMAYIGIGVTEFRLLVAFWPFAAIALHVPESLGDPVPAIDVAIFSLAGLAVVGLFTKWFLDGRKIAAATAREE